MKIRPGAQCVRKCLGIVVTVSAAVSCAPAPDRANTVAYYREHAEERDAQLKKCTDDPGSLGHQPDCVNAREATRLEGIGSQRELPPLDLPVERKPSTGS
jgi:hypothetical protein